MITNLESDVRNALLIKSGELPRDAVARVAAVDYRPRRGRFGTRGKLFAGAGTLAGAATVGTVISLGIGGTTAAYAGWTPTPTAASSPSPTATADCQSQLSSMPPVGGLDLAQWQTVLTDVRGPFTVGLFQDDDSYAACFTSSSFTEVSMISSGGVGDAAGQQPTQRNSVGVSGHSTAQGQGTQGPTGGFTSAVIGGTRSGDLEQVVQTHVSIQDADGPYTLVDGRVASGVSAVTLVRDDGEDVVASVADGWLIAWWPGTTTATSARVTGGAGTSTEALGSIDRTMVTPPTSGSCASGTGRVDSSGAAGGPTVTCVSGSPDSTAGEGTDTTGG